MVKERTMMLKMVVELMTTRIDLVTTTMADGVIMRMVTMRLMAGMIMPTGVMTAMLVMITMIRVTMVATTMAGW